VKFRHVKKPVVAAVAALLLAGGGAAAFASGGSSRPIVLGQTEGYANGRLTVFDYTDNFVCANDVLNSEDCQSVSGPAVPATRRSTPTSSAC
jgi:hypothetical protein